MDRKKFSIVIPIYYNELNIPHTVPRLRKLQEILTNYDLEFIFVDDGSGDKSLKMLVDERNNDDRIKILKLSKNFGAMSAIQAGLHYATGDCVGIIAADLQDPPELFAEMIQKWESGKKVVLAVRSDREESFSQKLFSNTYYYFMDKFAISGYPSGGFDFVLIDKQVVDELNHIKEKNTNIMSLIFWLGHERDSIPYVRQKRTVGKSRWTLSKKIKLFVDSFISFSFLPIKVMSSLGFFVALLSFIYGVVTVVSTLIGKTPIKGWASLIAIVTFLLGLIMVMLGVIGEYLWRILDETRNRPTYIIDEEYI